MKTSQPPAIGARPLSLDNGCSTNQVLERGGHEIPRAHRFTIDVWDGVFRCLRTSEDRSGDPSATGLRPDRSEQRPLHLRAHESDDCRKRKSIASHSPQCSSVRRSVRRRPEATDRIRLRRSISHLLCVGGLWSGRLALWFEDGRVIQLHLGRNAARFPVMDTSSAIRRFEAQALCQHSGAAKAFDEFCVVHGA